MTSTKPPHSQYLACAEPLRAALCADDPLAHLRSLGHEDVLWGELFTLYRERLVGVALTHLYRVGLPRNRQDAEDIVDAVLQEAKHQCFNHLHFTDERRFDDESDLMRYLRRSIHNKAYKRYCAARRCRNLDQGVAGDHALDCRWARHAAECADGAARALATLPPDSLIPFMFQTLADPSIRKLVSIESLLGITENNRNVRVTRARMSVKKILREAPDLPRPRSIIESELPEAFMSKVIDATVTGNDKMVGILTTLNCPVSIFAALIVGTLFVRPCPGPMTIGFLKSLNRGAHIAALFSQMLFEPLWFSFAASVRNASGFYLSHAIRDKPYATDVEVYLDDIDSFLNLCGIEQTRDALKRLQNNYRSEMKAFGHYVFPDTSVG